MNLEEKDEEFNFKIVCSAGIERGSFKTTTLFNLANHLSGIEKQRVLLVDTDPQCNLTSLFINRNRDIEQRICRDKRPDIEGEDYVNIGESLLEIREGYILDPSQVTALNHQENENLYLLPGHIKVKKYGELLEEIEHSSNPSPCIPGALYSLIKKSAKAVNADIILIDTSGDLGCLNMITTMSSHYFYHTCRPQYFTSYGVDLVSKSLEKKEYSWIDRYEKLVKFTKNAKYNQLPNRKPKFLGMVIPTDSECEINNLNEPVFINLYKNNGMLLKFTTFVLARISTLPVMNEWLEDLSKKLIILKK